MGRERGFTIIEVVLFLAIAGSLFALLMVGISTGIAQQRYSESVRSYKALLQDQYLAAVNIRNQKTDTDKCDPLTGRTDGTARNDWGASACVILGRVIQVVPGRNGETVEVSSVVGIDPGSQSASGGDLAALRAYKPVMATFDKQSIDLDWGARLTTASGASSQAATTTVLILRSPVSGLMRVFTEASKPADLLDMITDTSASRKLSNCIVGDTSLPKQMVTIDPSIASVDGITVDGGTNADCQA